VIEPSTANPVSKRENLDDGEGNVKRVKLDGRVFFQAQDKNRVNNGDGGMVA
jgi:hypothetical protein